MSLIESRGQLTKMHRDLMNRWMMVRSEWNDNRAQYFEDQYLRTLEIEIRKTVAAMDQMNVVLNKIVQDCE
jgi:hypothetical protein